MNISECDEEHPCQGLGEHAHFKNFGMAFLTLFRVATGDNWNGIMKVSFLYINLYDIQPLLLLIGYIEGRVLLRARLR